MNRTYFNVKSCRKLTADVWELILSGDTSAIKLPGEFVNLEAPGYFLRRPISISDWDENTLTLLIKEVGAGTRDLLRYAKSITGRLDILTGLGNGFHMNRSGDRPIIIGGGIGAAPLYGLTKRLMALGKHPALILGFRTEADILYQKEFMNLGCPVQIATEDGSAGVKGFVTDCLPKEKIEYIFACGPLPMLRAVDAQKNILDGQYSFEARMGCGFGACMGCTIPVKNGLKRVCKDGPVLYKEEIVWQT